MNPNETYCKRAPSMCFLEALASAPKAVSFEVWWPAPLCFPSFSCWFFRWKEEWKLRMKSTFTLNLLGSQNGRRRDVVTKIFKWRVVRIRWCVFLFEAYLQSRITNTRILQVTNESQAFQKMFHTYTTMYRCVFRRIQIILMLDLTVHFLWCILPHISIS